MRSRRQSRLTREARRNREPTTIGTSARRSTISRMWARSVVWGRSRSAKIEQARPAGQLAAANRTASPRPRLRS